MNTVDRSSNQIADDLVRWAGWCHVQNIKAELQAVLYRGSEEIERLTAELVGVKATLQEEFRENARRAEKIDGLKATVEELRTVSAGLLEQAKGDAAHIAALGRMVDRLRAALERHGRFRSEAVELIRRAHGTLLHANASIAVVATTHTLGQWLERVDAKVSLAGAADKCICRVGDGPQEYCPVHGRQPHETDARPCTCHPTDRPLVCQHRYALSACREAAGYPPLVNK